MESQVLLEYHGNICEVIFNRPKALNALTLDMVRTITSEVQKWNQTPSVKAVIFKGNGGRAFCCGGDMKRVHEAKTNPVPDGYLETFFKEAYVVDTLIAEMKPVQIVFWEGVVMGGGVGMSIHAPIKIATENTLFAMPEARVGLVPDVGAGYFLPKLRNRLGYYVGLTAIHLKGQEVVQVGLADYFVRRENLQKLEEEIIQKTNSDTTVEDLRNIVSKYEEVVERKYPNEELINDLFGRESLEKIYNAIKECEIDKEFAKKTLEAMDSLCPLSLRVAFELLERGKKLDMKDNFRMDLRLMRRFMNGSDVTEGIRCILIDKGSKPNWSHKSIFEVIQEEVEKKFEKSENEDALPI